MIIYGIWFYLITIYLNLYGLVDCGIITPREMDVRRVNNMEIRKRPFCNAFTGCGKKRSANIPYNLHDVNGNSLNNNNNNNQNNNGQPEEMDNSLSDLIDLNSEPAVEDLMRQIMSQAKLWEAIQEASREISLQKQHGDRGLESRFPIFNAQ